MRLLGSRVHSNDSPAECRVNLGTGKRLSQCSADDYGRGVQQRHTWCASHDGRHKCTETTSCPATSVCGDRCNSWRHGCIATAHLIRVVQSLAQTCCDCICPSSNWPRPSVAPRLHISCMHKHERSAQYQFVDMIRKEAMCKKRKGNRRSYAGK